MNQQGFSSLVLLTLIVLGVFIIWEANESINMFSVPPPQPSASPNQGSDSRTFCPTGEESNCNDSNDQFLFTE